MEDKRERNQEIEEKENEAVDNAAEDQKNQKEENEEELFSSKKKMKKKIEELEGEVSELKDKNLRIFAEFDNFRKRSARERIEFARTAGQDIIADLLPVLDDFKRANESVKEAKDVKSVQEGFHLIYQKFRSGLEQKGLKEMDAMGKEFNPEIHEAVTEIPAPNEDLKGKVVDVIQNGYYLNDKIIRYAKVVVGK